MEANSEFNPDKTVDETEVKADVQLHAVEKNRFAMFLQVFFDDEKDANVPFDINIAIVGHFSIDEDDFNDIVSKAFLLRNAAGMLYASCREMIGMTTSRSPYPTLIIPAYYFSYEMLLSKKEQEILHEQMTEQDE